MRTKINHETRKGPCRICRNLRLFKRKILLQSFTEAHSQTSHHFIPSLRAHKVDLPRNVPLEKLLGEKKGISPARLSFVRALKVEVRSLGRSSICQRLITASPPPPLSHGARQAPRRPPKEARGGMKGEDGTWKGRFLQGGTDTNDRTGLKSENDQRKLWRWRDSADRKSGSVT